MRNWLRSRAGLKVISLVLAMITWFFVKAVTSDSRLVENVPLEIRVKPGMAVEDASTRMLNVTVRGTTEDIRIASRNELFGVLDLSHAETTGNVNAAISPHLIRHPRRVRIVAVEPTSVTVRIEPAAE